MAIKHIDCAAASRVIACLVVILPVTAAGQTARKVPPVRIAPTTSAQPVKGDSAASDEPESCRVHQVTAFPGSHQFATDFIETIATDPDADDSAEVIWGVTADLSINVPAQQQAMYISKSIDGGATWTSVAHLD